MSSNQREIELHYFKSSGPGGQHKNKRFSAVKAIHVPTGIAAIACDQRSQFQNKTAALKRLEQKLARFRKKKKKRIPTKPSSAAKEKILEAKKHRAQKKRLRTRVREDDAH